MSTADRYRAYAEAFELSLADDDWTRLEQYFTEDAVYRPDGTPDSDVTGRDAVLARLKGLGDVGSEVQKLPAAGSF